MSIYHCSVSTVSRSAGRSSVAAAMYRACEVCEDKRTALTHDFTRKRGLIHAELVFPDHVKNRISRAELWNLAEAAETRKNSVTAREVEVSLPHELPRQSQLQLARDFAQLIAEKHKVAVDVCVHEPNPKGDQRNVHAHLLMTTRRVETDCTFGPKTRELDMRQSGAVVEIREAWSECCNRQLEQHMLPDRVSHMSLLDQGIMREPQQHVGPIATAMQRRGVETDRTRFRSEEKSEIKDELNASLANKEEINKNVDEIKNNYEAEKQMQAQIEQEKNMIKQQYEAEKQRVAEAERQKEAEERAKYIQEHENDYGMGM